MKKLNLTLLLIILVISFAVAQNQGASAAQDNYTLVITKRADKIVKTLNITDSAKYKRVQTIIVNQYRTLSAIHDTRNAQVKDIAIKEGDDKAKAKLEVAVLDSNVDIQLNQAHKNYLAQLGKELSPEQIDRVKNEMTYNVLPVTYGAYLDELPDLTEIQKQQIMSWLVEAREHAIDAESSEKKHAWFGKYKGRINNYLSKQGYDMKKAEVEWQKRIKERQAQKG